MGFPRGAAGISGTLGAHRRQEDSELSVRGAYDLECRTAETTTETTTRIKLRMRVRFGLRPISTRCSQLGECTASASVTIPMSRFAAAPRADRFCGAYLVGEAPSQICSQEWACRAKMTSVGRSHAHMLKLVQVCLGPAAAPARGHFCLRHGSRDRSEE